MKLTYKIIAAALAASLTGYGFAQSSSLTRAAELRIDKLADAQVVSQLAVGTAVQVVSLEGGWAQVQASGKSGWVRASSLALSSGASAVSGMASGRDAKGNKALTLGVRSISARSNRHALIIGVGRYGDPAIPSLPGAEIDKESATQMATAMQVPPSNITYLHDEKATGDGIRNAIRALNDRVLDGDRVFIHYSGHGTRSKDPNGEGCVEALLAYEGNYNAMITNKEMASLLSPITNKTDKLFVMYDACHSGGVISNASTARTRGFKNINDDGVLRPKFAAISEECGKPVNIKTRNLLVEAVAQKTLPQDIVHLSSSRDNEVSFDDEQKGGLATQYMRDCMLRDAADLDGSGAITMEEIKQCAQTKIDNRMKADPLFKAHNLMLTGNADFVPAWFSHAAIVATAPAVAPAPAVMPAPVVMPTTAPTPAPAPQAMSNVASQPVPTAPASAVTTSPPVAALPVATLPVAALPVVTPPAPLTGEQALKRLFEQRDGKRKVTVTTNKTELKIGQDTMDFNVKSDKAGYVYVALAGSDNESLYVLFPNDLDKNNRIEAGQTLALPRPNWKVRAGGPEGTDQVLIVVSDGPRDLTALAKSKAGPFTASLNNADGRAQLGALLTNSEAGSTAACNNAVARKINPHCSDAFGAAMLRVAEVK
jgi:Caspase domain/Domain of unknown function (DUF4384)/Bacterial SH3 domain